MLVITWVNVICSASYEYFCNFNGYFFAYIIKSVYF